MTDATATDAIVTLRPLFGKVLAVVVALIIAVSLITLVMQGEWRSAVAYGPLSLAFGFLVWMTYWLPAVEVSSHGVRLVNVFRTVTVPWGAIERIETRFALALYAGGRRYVGWAATSGGRHRMVDARRSGSRYRKQLPESTFTEETMGLGDVPDTDSGDAAIVVRRHWERLRNEGELVDGEHTVHVRWNPAANGVLAALVVLGLVALTFA